MGKLLGIGEGDAAAPLVPVPAKTGVDVPLADYEADMLLKVAKQK